MAETPIQRLLFLIDSACARVGRGDLAVVELEAAQAILAEVEADAAVGAAVRECDERGLRYQRMVYDDGTTMAIHIWQPCCQPGSPGGYGTTFREALADWKLRTGVEE